MTSVLLIYPFFKPRRDRSVFRFPPLGISYIAASLQAAGHLVSLIDCTFLDRSQALQSAAAVGAEVVGIYAMVTMADECAWFARQLRSHCKLLVAGGPLPSCDPEPFLAYFDVVVQGEGEVTITELLHAFETGSPWQKVAGIVYRAISEGENKYIYTAPRAPISNLDLIPFPARNLLPNESYINHSKKKYGYAITTVMSTRGCPFHCEFCSNVIFGGSFRERSAGNVVDEIEDALALGYDRISFADDVFTLNKGHVLGICAEIERRGLAFNWECLARVDAIDYATALAMKKAGCLRIYFGIESGSDRILLLMHKQITTEQARQAVEAAHQAGIQVGAFFILCYPGDTDDTVLQTLHYATTLPLDYIGLSMPYPLPGTELFKRMRSRITRNWHPDGSLFGSHELIFNADYSPVKTWFAIIKGHAQFSLKKRLGKTASVILKAFEKITDTVFRMLR